MTHGFLSEFLHPRNRGKTLGEFIAETRPPTETASMTMDHNTIEERYVTFATAALQAHERAAGIDGDEGIQLWHLLVSLQEFCRVRGLDWDEISASARNEVVG